MSSHEEFITMVIALREAQKEFEEKHTHQSMMDRIKYEQRVDVWIQKHIAEKVQLDFWTRSVKGSEMPGVYDVGHGDKEEQTFET